MVKIDFQITEEDIKDYLERHSDSKLLKYREPLFVKYIKHRDIFSIEKVEMLTCKSGINNLSVYGECDSKVTKCKLPSFNDYIIHQHVDASATMHIMIPILKLYEKKIGNITLTNGHVEKYLPINLDEYNCGVLVDTIENYQVAGKIRGNIEEMTKISDINMSAFECKSELVSYEEIYGKDEVEKIKKLVKEG